MEEWGNLQFCYEVEYSCQLYPIGSSWLVDQGYQGLKKSYKESLTYLHAAKVPYEEILTAARGAETKLDDYKETGATTANAAQWNAQQNSQQKQMKQGDGQNEGNTSNPNKRKKNDTCYGCGGTDHFIKDCPNPHTGSKRGERRIIPPPHLLQQRKKQEPQPRKKRSPQKKKTRPQMKGKNRTRTWNSCVMNFVLFDTILTGSSISMIDVYVCEKLHLPINPWSVIQVRSQVCMN